MNVERAERRTHERFDRLRDRAREALRRQLVRLRRDEREKIAAIREGATKVSADGIEFIASWEGFRADAYRDVVGIWTIGYGHTEGVRAGQRVTRREALGLLRLDARIAEHAVEHLVTVRLSQRQFDALVSFTFNCGTGALSQSTLLDLLNAGRYGAVPGELLKWVNAGGAPVAGLVNRRKAECRMWQRGS